MKVLLTGAAGQLGQALRQHVPAGIELIATSRGGDPATGLLPLDLADADACRAAVLSHRPEWVLNGGAYTAVDRAESEPELALAVNGERLLQVSTDFVFNGQQGSPYRPGQGRDPLGAYGATKAAGKEAVEQLLTASGQALGVVEDQVVGCPTSTATLAAACWRVITANVREPVLHWCDASAASWFDVAVAVGELAQKLGLQQQPAPVNPLTTAEYPLPAQRPSYSLLDCSSRRRALQLAPTPWRQALRQLLQAL
jgi:dTDP-4-dehydrorhamnose reductase